MSTSKQEGRPRDPAISRALVRAAERRMEADGFDGLTVDGIVNEVGTTRQAFYRRHRSVSLLAVGILLDRFGRTDAVDTGRLESDLLELQRNDVAMMTAPLVRKSLPGLLEGVRRDPEVRGLYLEGLLRPRRRSMALALSRAAERGEARSDVDPEYVCDLLFGALLARALLPTGLPLDDRLARRTVATALHEIAIVPGRRPEEAEG